MTIADKCFLRGQLCSNVKWGLRQMPLGHRMEDVARKSQVQLSHRHPAEFQAGATMKNPDLSVRDLPLLRKSPVKGLLTIGRPGIN